MSRFPNPALDGTLISLKGIATAGGERGPLYDQGVLSVIDQIESTGSFTPDPIKFVYAVHWSLTSGTNIVTPEEVAEAEQMVRKRGWTLEQGAQYATGVKDAQSLLSVYDRTKADA